MLRVPWYRQSPGYCGPTALRMVLALYGLRVSEAALVKLTGCKPVWHPEGTSAAGIVRAAKRFGLRATVRDRASIADLRRAVKAGWPPIVDWFSEDDGHYSVVVDVTASRVALRDPEKPGLIRFRHADFERLWFDFSGARIERPSDVILRRMIVVQPPAA